MHNTLIVVDYFSTYRAAQTTGKGCLEARDVELVKLIRIFDLKLEWRLCNVAKLCNYIINVFENHLNFQYDRGINFISARILIH